MPVLSAIQVVDAQEALGLGHALLADRHRLLLLVDLEVEVGHELLLGARVHAFRRFARHHPRRELGELHVQVGRLFRGAGDDQRRARLVDQDVVDLIHDREVVPTLDLFAEILGHVVAQVVEAELRVGAVDHVAGVRALLFLEGLHVLQHAHGHAERVVDRAHPFGVASRQVVVDGHHVHAPALRCLAVGVAVGDGMHRQRVEHHSQRRSQRLALACLHLRDLALVQGHRADHLHVEVAHAHRALTGLAHDRKALRQQRVEILALAGALAQRVHPLAQLGVAVVFELGLERPDQRYAFLVGLELLRLADIQREIEHGGHVPKDSSRRCRRCCLPARSSRPAELRSRRGPCAQRPRGPRGDGAVCRGGA